MDLVLFYYIFILLKECSVLGCHLCSFSFRVDLMDFPVAAVNVYATMLT